MRRRTGVGIKYCCCKILQPPFGFESPEMYGVTRIDSKNRRQITREESMECIFIGFDFVNSHLNVSPFCVFTENSVPVQVFKYIFENLDEIICDYTFPVSAITFND